MLPDFPEIKLVHQKIADQQIQIMVRQDPLFSLVRTEKHFEGNGLSIKRSNDETEKSHYKEISSKFTIEREQIIEKGIIAYIEHFNKVAEDIKRQQAQLLFSNIEEATSKTGNIVDGKGRSFSPELFFQALEKIWIEFDDQGQPFLPTMVVSPELGAKIKDKLPVWDSDPDYKKKFDEIIEKKKAEWNDRESDRKLAD